MQIRKHLIIILFIFIVLFSVVCVITTKTVEENQETAILFSAKDMISKEELGKVKEIYLVIFPTKNASQPTFFDLNSLIKEEVRLDILFQEGKDGQPKLGMFGYGLTSTNGTIELRGQSARIVSQKSYKIRLNENAGLWEGNRIINLNKHPFDDLKIRNKLSYDYINQIDHLASLKTQFVHLYIKDLSNPLLKKQDFQDYGLYVQVENVDKDFLKRNGLHPKGSLYKAINFEFYRYPDKLKLRSDPDYNEKDFEKILEIKSDDEHDKLLQMLDDVNNKLIHINDVIEEHFDRNNYITWLAVNLIFGNVDGNSGNYFLYSPKDSKKWYFIPWDYDKGWGAYKFEKGQWQEGVSNYWGVVLHRRFLENKDNVEELKIKIEQLTKILTEQNAKYLTDVYQPIVEDFLTREPDNLHSKISLKQIRAEFKQLPQSILDNKKRFYHSLETPMPVFMNIPQKIAKNFVFSWSKSFDFQDDIIQYSLDVSASPKFDHILYHKENIKETQFIANLDLKPGKYYWRLRIKDNQGNSQDSFNYVIENSTYYFGISTFTVK